MYKPLFNKLLIEVDDKDSQWGKSDTSLGGEVYREGKLIEAGLILETSDYPGIDSDEIGAIVNDLIGKHVMWNEGHEAGTVFEDGGKKYALIYWFDLIGVK